MEYALELLLLEWNKEYPTLKEERENKENGEDNNFSSQEKKMNGLVEAVVLIWTAKIRR